MIDESRNLWPTTLKPRSLRTPISVLRRQAEELYQQTKGLLRGEIIIDGKDANLSVHFNVVAPALGRYHLWVFTVNQPAEVFPVTLKSREPGSAGVESATLEEFETNLAALLASKWVIDNVNALWGESVGEG